MVALLLLRWLLLLLKVAVRRLLLSSVPAAAGISRWVLLSPTLAGWRLRPL